MSLSTAFLACLTRERLTEALTPTYAKLKNLDLEEAYGLLEEALFQPQLLAGIQQAIADGLLEVLPEKTEEQHLTRLQKRLDKSRRFKPPNVRSREEGAWVALTTRIDIAAGVCSGEARDLLYSPGGQELLEQGYAQLGRHLAKELTR